MADSSRTLLGGLEPPSLIGSAAYDIYTYTYVRTQTDTTKRITLLRIRAQGNYVYFIMGSR